MVAAETSFFHVLVVYLGYGLVAEKPSMPVSLFLEANRIEKQIQTLEHAVN